MKIASTTCLFKSAFHKVPSFNEQSSKMSESERKNTDQKYVLITGASAGIGYELAKVFSAEGYKVIGASRTVMDSQSPLVAKHGVISVPCDITKLDDIKRLEDVVFKETGGYLDILYNNAGIAIGGPAAEMDETKVDMMFQANVIGQINVTKHLAPFVVNAKGIIVFTGSVSANLPLAWSSVYSATKAAIDAYARTLHGEMEPFGVKVYNIITGGVNTGIGAKESPAEVEKLLQNSLYNVDGLSESIIATKEMTEKDGMNAGLYARDVVQKILGRPNKFNLYGGGNGYTLNFIGRYYPLWSVEYIMQWYFKQLRVFRNIRKLVLKGA